MTSGEYLLGAFVVAVTIASLVAVASSARRIWFPDWPHAPAYVAEVVTALVAVLVVSEILGSIGWFTRWRLVLSLAAVATASLFVVRRRPRQMVGRAALPSSRCPPSASVLAIAVVIASGSQALATTSSAFHGGLRGFDSLWYHMPFAARFMQDASLTGLHFIGNAPTTFYPANGEVIHSLGMVLVRYDLLSPLINLAWFAFALLAGWCIGRADGVAPITAAAVALIASVPVMGAAQTATALNDMAAFALLLAAVALLMTRPDSSVALLIAGLAAGLAVGTKLNLWPAVIALGAVVVWVAPGSRWDAARRWLLGVTVAGGFWYVRNLIEVGNPLPWFGLKLGDVLTIPSTTAPVDCGRTAVAHYLTDPAFVTAHLLPQARAALGSQWWLLLSLSTLGVVGGAFFGRTRLERGIGLTAAASAVVYLFTPTTAGGENASCFAFNTRFAVPAIGLGLILLPLFLSRWRFGSIAAAVAIAVTYAVAAQRAISPGAVLTITVLLAAIWGATQVDLDRVPRTALAVGVVAAVLLVGALGWHEAQIYLRSRYATNDFSEPIGLVAMRLRDVHDARIAVTGFAEHYPFYGVDLSNRVEFPAQREGARFLSYSTCRDWLSALTRRRYDYVVAAVEGGHDAPAARWTRRYPGVRLLSSLQPPQRDGAGWRWQFYKLDSGGNVNPAVACETMSG